MRHSRVEANGVGVIQAAGAGGTSFIRHSRIAGNSNQRGARNDDYPTTTVDADSVWWGDPAGPNCAPAIGSCPTTGADSVLTLGVSFADPLGAVPPTPAPPVVLPVAPAAAPSALRPASRSAVPFVRRAAPPSLRAATPRPPRPGREAPRMSWQRGRQPRLSAPPHER
jgi:hypothetical protein